MGVSVRLKSGSWYIFIRHAGERAAQKYKSEDEANAVAAAVRNKIALGEFDIAALKKKKEPQEKPNAEPTVPTVQNYYDDTFLPVYLESAVAKSTAASHRNNFEHHINPALGSSRLDEIDYKKMEDFVSNLVKAELAKATIETIIKNLRTLLNHARKRKIIVDHSVTGLAQLYSQAKAKHEQIEPLMKKEVPLFLAAVKQHAPQHYALFFTLIQTGIRSGEAAGLQLGDIDFTGKYFVVQRSIDRIHKKVVPTKTKHIRRVDLSNELIAVLKDHIREQKESWLKREIQEGEKPKPQPVWLFPNEEGKWSDMRNIADRHFDRCMEKAGLHTRRLHDLRHTFASLMLTAGAPIQYVSEQMGHHTIQLTVKLYGHLQPGANRHWMNKLPGAKKPRRVATSGNQRQKMKKAANSGLEVVEFKSGTRDSNPRLQPWQDKVD